MFQEKTSGFEEVRSGSSYLFEVGLGCLFLVLLMVLKSGVQLTS